MKIILVLTAVLAANIVTAAPLITFSNGEKTDADDVNVNFNELASRIEDIPAGPNGQQGIQGIQGEQGLQGVQGPQGVQGLPGPELTEYVTSDYRTNASRKVFDAYGSAWDTETRIYEVSDYAPGLLVIRNREKEGEPVMADIFFTRWDQSIITLGARWSFSPRWIETLFGNQPEFISTLETPILTHPYTVKIGVPWVSTSKVRTDYMTSTTITYGVVVDTRTLIAIEDVTVPAGEYFDCLKILVQHDASTFDGSYQQVSWHCPNRVGIVKEIQGSNAESEGWVIEMRSFTR